MRVISDEVYKKFLHSPNMPEPSLRYQKLGCWSTPGFYQVPEVNNDWHLDLSDTPIWMPTYGGDWEIGELVPLVSQVKPLADYVGARTIDEFPTPATVKAQGKVVPITPQAFFGLHRVMHVDMYYLLKLAAKLREDVEITTGIPGEETDVCVAQETGLAIVRNDSPFEDVSPDVFYELLNPPLEQLVELYFLYLFLEFRIYTLQALKPDGNLYMKLIIDSTVPWQVLEMLGLVGKDAFVKALTRAVYLSLELTCTPGICQYILDKSIASELLQVGKEVLGNQKDDELIFSIFDYLVRGQDPLVAYAKGVPTWASDWGVAIGSSRSWSLGNVITQNISDLVLTTFNIPVNVPGLKETNLVKRWNIHNKENSVTTLSATSVPLLNYVTTRINLINNVLRWLPMEAYQAILRALTAIYTGIGASSNDRLVLDLLYGEG